MPFNANHFISKPSEGMDAMNFENLMNALASRQQVGPFEYKDDQFRFTIDGKMNISSFQANGRFYAYCKVTRLPEDAVQREDLLKIFLERNMVVLEHERVSLCLDPDGKSLAVFVSSPMSGLTLGVLEDHIAALANIYDYYSQGAGQSTLPPPSPSMLML